MLNANTLKGKKRSCISLHDLAFYINQVIRKGRLSPTHRGREAYTLPMAEHIAVIQVVVVHEQFAAIGGIVEVVCEIAHCEAEVVALVNDMPIKGFLVLPLATVAALEAVEALASPLHKSVHGLLVVDFRQPDIFGDFIPCFFAEQSGRADGLPHAAFAVPLTGEIS